MARFSQGLIRVVMVLMGMMMLTGCVYHRTLGDFAAPDGVRIHYYEQGRGEPVILVHGFAVNADLNWRWVGVSRALARDYRVIAFDNRGHGLSGKPHDPDQYGMEMVEDVVRLMDHLKIPRAHVAGYSLGGYITLKLMMMHPDRIISAAPCAAGWERGDGENMRRIGEMADRLERGEGFKPILRALDPKEDPFADLRMLTVDACLRYMNDTKAMAAAVRSISALEVKEWELRANRIPALTIVGSEDPLKKGADALSVTMTNHRIVVLKGANHHSAIKRPRFARELKKFLDQHREKGR
ncbi:MAG TPA: alpha/beta hydrolase [Candidatus Hydrogenedentes bacterium]|nr:alpha/beta hydrolase [Candidatus Hydrogenedentota bacterium]